MIPDLIEDGDILSVQDKIQNVLGQPAYQLSEITRALEKLGLSNNYVETELDFSKRIRPCESLMNFFGDSDGFKKYTPFLKSAQLGINNDSPSGKVYWIPADKLDGFLLAMDIPVEFFEAVGNLASRGRIYDKELNEHLNYF